MTRTCFAALAAVFGLASAAPAQVYTTYYTPGYTTYYHAPAYTNYSYTTGYGLRSVFDRRRWTGSTAYTSPYYTAYTPTYSYTAAYAPAVTSYYSPAVDPAVACCPTNPCCTPCALACASCPGGTCPGGDCSLNYGPVDMTPRPDANASGTSGSRRFESESDGTGGTSGTRDNFRPTNPDRPDDGYNDTSRGAGYSPQTPIEQRAPTDEPEEEADPAPAGETEEELTPPAALLNLDTALTHAPSLLRERLPMRARFGSPKLARTEVDPATLLDATELRLVRK